MAKPKMYPVMKVKVGPECSHCGSKGQDIVQFLDIEDKVELSLCRICVKVAYEILRVEGGNSK